MIATFRGQATQAAGLSDAQLVEVFSRYGALILRWAERIFRDGATADDVLHELMLRLLKKGAVFLGLEHEGQRRQWLYRTTLRLCWDIKAKHKLELVRDEEGAGLPEPRRHGASEERDLLDGLLRQLDVEERILAVLFFEEGYTKVEIHALTGRSRPFIDKKLDRISCALRLLQDCAT
jgi:RNA polymerase sigma factor (sigma-70 family)